MDHEGGMRVYWFDMDHDGGVKVCEVVQDEGMRVYWFDMDHEGGVKVCELVSLQHLSLQKWPSHRLHLTGARFCN